MAVRAGARALEDSTLGWVAPHEWSQREDLTAARAGARTLEHSTLGSVAPHEESRQEDLAGARCRELMLGVVQ